MKILLPAEVIRQGVERLAREITEAYQGESLTVVGVLTGSIVLLADLIRQIDLPLQLGLVQARSYRGNATRPGTLTINAQMLPDLQGRNVLLVDDIFDTGRTLFELLTQFDELNPASLRTAVLLRKQGRSEVEFEPHFVGFDIPDEFVIGYGLDFNDQYRNLPYVAAIEPHELSPEPRP